MIEVAFRYMPKPEKWKNIHNDAVRGFRGGVSWSKAFEKLRYELARIKAERVVVEAGYKPEQVRVDGWPYSNAKPEHFAVRVSFTASGGPMAFMCAGWKSVEYNAYMIAMTLERLRAIDRYGCTQGGEQYKGWSQLPPGREPIAAAEWPSVDAAVRFLVRVAGWIEPPPVPANIDAVWRDAAKKAHPDAGGNDALFVQVNRARDFIKSGGVA